MGQSVYSLNNPKEYKMAGPYDLVELIAPPGRHPLILPKWIPEAIVYAIVNHEKTHLSGPTGSAKTKLAEDLQNVPENFEIICQSLGYPVLPLKVFAVEMAIFEAPSELWQRRAISGGNTFDELSILIQYFQKAEQLSGSTYPVIHLREFGRVHSSSVQSGLPDIMAEADILMPDGNRIDGRNIAWLCDSNYQDEENSTYTLVTLDDALKRRFTVHICMDYLTPEQEVTILQHITKYY
jgi:hypothetical protein